MRTDREDYGRKGTPNFSNGQTCTDENAAGALFRLRCDSLSAEMSALPGFSSAYSLRVTALFAFAGHRYSKNMHPSIPFQPLPQLPKSHYTMIL